MKTYVLYHANCPDGFGAAFAAWLHLGSNAEYIPVLYGKDPPKLEPASKVYIVDFSYPAPVLMRMAATQESVTVLDHHATAEKDLSVESFLNYCGLDKDHLRDNDDRNFETKDGFNRCANVHVHFDMSKSGSVLAFEFFHAGREVPKFFLYLQDRDLWQWKLEKSREVSYALRSIPMDFLSWVNASGIVPSSLDRVVGDRTRIHSDTITLLEKLMRDGDAMLRLVSQQVSIMAKNHRWVCFQNGSLSFLKELKGPAHIGEQHIVPCSNASVFFSEVGEKLLEMYPTAQFSAYYFDRIDGKRQWGIRARKGFNAATLIAKPMGGGGHEQACGFTTPL
jgi:uncharacterized protein